MTHITHFCLWISCVLVRNVPIGFLGLLLCIKQSTWEGFLNATKIPVVTLIFIPALSLWPLCLMKKKWPLGITAFFTQVETQNSSEWVWPQLTQPRANLCLFASFYWLCKHLSSPWYFSVPFEWKLKHTFRTAVSNMLQKMGNCLKLPVLRVRSSMSEKIENKWSITSVSLFVPVVTFILR